MKKFFPFFFLIAILFSQYSGYGPPKIATLSGKIIDQKTNKPVPYATITLFHVRVVFEKKNLTMI